MYADSTRGRVKDSHYNEGLRGANTKKHGEQTWCEEQEVKEDVFAGARCLPESGAMPMVGTLAHDLNADDRPGSQCMVRSETRAQSMLDVLCTVPKKEDHL
jgi:hypothetical protein